MTSAHLVADAGEVTVTLPDGEQHMARVLGRASEVDIAALRIADDTALPPLHSGSGLSEARTGDIAFAIGGGVVTTGSIRALRDPTTTPGGGQLDAIRIDAEIPRDSIGGPLVNDDGYVLGVLGVLTTTTDEATDRGGGVAIPVDIARHAALEIVRNNQQRYFLTR